MLRWEGIPSPDGKWIAHQDKDNQLWLLEYATKTQKQIRTMSGRLSTPARSSRACAGRRTAAGSPSRRSRRTRLSQIVLYNVETGVHTPITTDRYDSHWASWSPDGKWIYFVSDRALKSSVSAPWGARQPEPYFDRANKIYLLALQKGLRSPFEPADELHPDKKDEPPKPTGDAPKAPETKPEASRIPRSRSISTASRRGCRKFRLLPGNYSDLAVCGKAALLAGP